MLPYSAFVEDFDTMGFFFAFHETRASPSLIQYPVTDMLESLHVAQFESYIVGDELKVVG